MSGHEFEYDFAGTGTMDLDDRSTNIDQATIAEMNELIARYPDKRSALGPILHLVQSVDGRVSAPGVEIAAALLDIPPAQVQGFATFYTMYHKKPAGKHHIGVCTTALCAVLGGDALLDCVEKKLGIHADETTPDGEFSLERIECNAACDFAPVVMANWEFMDNMTPEKAEQLIDDLRAGKPVQATRGATLTGWRDSERVLAGFSDGRADEGPSAGEPSLRGVQLAAEKGWTADSVTGAAPAPPDAPAAPPAEPKTEPKAATAKAEPKAEPKPKAKADAKAPAAKAAKGDKK
ncbi:MAG: NADH-quinone oxidoreductase subunit NuoE [Propionibacteriaceae bacterium]|jgi:NADH-quinone oxidoreductase subunit E|nr:NADH-quinone oxidoreductase subunit NuoE [Propionibacteriaceae bacterium]